MCDAQIKREFEYTDEESIEDDLICSICQEPYIDPVKITECCHVFCRSGIYQVLKNQSACPLCRFEPICYSGLILVEPSIVQRLDQLFVKCSRCNQSNIRRQQFNEHMKSVCPKAHILCTASDLQCSWSGLRDELDLHLITCRYHSIRDILEPLIKMKTNHDELAHQNRMLTHHVNGLKYRCKQLEATSRMSLHDKYVPMRCADIPFDASWKKNGLILAGGNGYGSRSHQLRHPQGIFVDEDGTIYIADFFNHRIVQWKPNMNEGKVVAGGNGQGDRRGQLNFPTDVIKDQIHNSLIICERGNKRVVSWSLADGTDGYDEVLVYDIDCNCLTMDEDRSLYITDIGKHEVRRWKLGDKEGTLVAGGNGPGDALHQLNYPTFVCVDRDHSVYVSDFENHRVMKWTVNAREGIIVAGGNGSGSEPNQSSYPGGVIVDQWGTVFVADSGSDRIMRWPIDATIGTVVVGGQGHGSESNRTNRPAGIAFDRNGNLYVAEYECERVQEFPIVKNSC